jgi:hypothetical protein
MTDTKQAEWDALNVALGKRAVHCRQWKWLAGMLPMVQESVLENVIAHGPASDGGPWTRTRRVGEPVEPPPEEPDLGVVPEGARIGIGYKGIRMLAPIPDLKDPATLGCLLELVRIVYEDHAVVCASVDYGPGGVRWQARQTTGGGALTEQQYETEAEALVAALENYHG